MGYIPTWNLPIHTMETWIMLAPWKTEVAMNDPIKIGGLSQHGETGKKTNGKQKGLALGGFCGFISRVGLRKHNLGSHNLIKMTSPEKAK